MSRYCSACGGLLGRDCFNEQDCLEISEINRQYEILEGAEVKEVEDFEPPDQRGKQKCKHCRDWKYNHGGRGCEVITSPVSDLFLFLDEIL